ncbi:hypothetical protein TWF506_009372 [Arthrobotrys conoides]|uniref:Uncharacterized protein n=1 Tax=Arthrobotrys conoides TaxID=74498 RepID=A0AAN8RM99_9PEZI
MRADLISFITATAALVHGFSEELTKSIDTPTGRIIEPRLGHDLFDNNTKLIVYRPDEKTRAQIERDQAKWAHEPAQPGLTKEEIAKFLREEPKGLEWFEGCDENQKGILIQTFLGVRALLEPLVKEWREFPVDWTSAAAIEFFGPPAVTQIYRATVEWNLSHIAQYLDPHNPPGSTSVRCDDPDKGCVDPYVVAYVPKIDHDPDRLDGGFIVFCAPFFKKYQNLQTIVKRVDSMDDPAQESINLGQFWQTRDAIMLHEMVHSPPRAFAHKDLVILFPKRKSRQIPDLVLSIPSKQPEEWRPIYGCDMVRALGVGLTKPVWDPVEPSSTAESYSCFVLATWVQKRWGRYPFRPLLALNITGLEGWTYRRGEASAYTKGEPEFNYTIRKLAVDSCKELAQPIDITTSFNSSTPVTRTFGIGITAEQCMNADWPYYDIDSSSKQEMEDTEPEESEL